MPEWGDKERWQVVRKVERQEVKCYTEWSFDIVKYDAYDCNKDKDEDPYNKTFVLSCGMYDGESIDLFDLQDWFDKNREWINELRKEIAK